MGALLVAWLLVVSFPETGEIQYYQFGSKGQCEEVIAPLVMFYEDFEQEVVIECKLGSLETL